MKLSYFLILIALSVHTVASAQTALAIPNSFTNGEIIDADKINQNFTGIETHINQNQGHKHLYVVDTNDVELGQVVGTEVDANPLLLSDKGYLYIVKRNPININVFFESNDCTGQAYTSFNVITDRFDSLMLNRHAFWNEKDLKYYFIDQSILPQTVNIQSMYAGGFSNALACNVFVTSTTMVHLNEATPGLTGVPSAITLPVRFEYK